MLLLRRFERFNAWSRIYFLEDGGFYFLQTYPPRPVFKRHSHTRMKMAAIIYKVASLWLILRTSSSYRRGGGGSRCAVVPRVTEALWAGQTGSATVASSLTRPAVLCSIAARLVRVGALDCSIIAR